MVEKEELRRGCANCWRVVFIILNILFFLIGLALVAFGIYLLVGDNTLRVLTGNQFASDGALILVAGVITAIISFVGILGAAGKWPVVLGFYIGLMVIIIVLEIAAAILGFVFREQLTEVVEMRIDEAIMSYSNDNPSADVNQLIDFIQNEFDCCGYLGRSDWNGTDFFEAVGMFPGSCNCTMEEQNNPDTCVFVPETNQFVWSRSCNTSVADFLASDQILGAIGGVGVVFGLIELFGLGVAIGLCACFCIMKREDDEFGKPI